MIHLMLATTLAFISAQPTGQISTEQNPENAARFLDALSKAGSIKMEIWEKDSYDSSASGSWNFTQMIRPNGGGALDRVTLEPYSVIGYNGDSRCLGGFHFTYTKKRYYDGFVEPDGVYRAESFGKIGLTISWAKVAKVSASSGTIELRDPANRVRFTFASEDLAIRAAYAMDVIRQSCDPTAGTGF